jgi:hypothetical protein
MSHLGMWCGSILALLAAELVTNAGCGSSDDSGPAMAPTSEPSDAGDDADEPILPGSGKPCTPQSYEVLGTKVSLDVNWPGTPGTNACAQASGCKGTVSLWLLSRFTINGTKGTGTTTMCGNQMPAVTLTSIGAQAEGVTSGSTAVSIQFLPSMWDAVAANAAKPPTAATGVFGGWNVGASFKVDPTVAFFGVKSSSALASASTTWPASGPDIDMADVTDDDNDGNPGITATPASGDGDSLPATGVATSPPLSPKADKLYVVLRTEISLYGLGQTCTDVTGKATATIFNDHVIGCHLEGGGDCTPPQWSFVDEISPVYVGDGVTIPPNVPAPSFAPAGMSGTFVSKVLSNDPDGGGIDCAAVRAAFP